MPGSPAKGATDNYARGLQHAMNDEIWRGMTRLLDIELGYTLGVRDLGKGKAGQTLTYERLVSKSLSCSMTRTAAKHLGGAGWYILWCIPHVDT